MIDKPNAIAPAIHAVEPPHINPDLTPAFIPGTPEPRSRSRGVTLADFAALREAAFVRLRQASQDQPITLRALIAEMERELTGGAAVRPNQNEEQSL